MTAIDLKTEIVQMIKDEQDTSILEAIRVLLYKLGGVEEVDDDLSDEEVAELESRRARHLRGEGTSYTLEESIQKLRNAGK